MKRLHACVRLLRARFPLVRCATRHQSTSPARPKPALADYAQTSFADQASLTVSAGAGGHGCVSFLREKFIEFGPPNGGDGGTGGSVFIQAVSGETSLHKLGRRSLLRAQRGKNGQGKSQGGQRGEDLLIQVPIGTIVREKGRMDPIASENQSTDPARQRDRWMLFPSASTTEISQMEFPPLPEQRRIDLAAAEPPAPIYLDLSKPTPRPLLLAAGAKGGLGNPHFLSRERPRPKFATKGEDPVTLELELELKLLADVGFVGLPNAGKSTLLRALSRSRARVGDWAFTTLQPNLGTVVLDNNRDRPQVAQGPSVREPLTRISIADIPGLVENAHLDKGLGLDFLRHVERARVLAFVLDLSAGDAVQTLRDLWRELCEFEKVRGRSVGPERMVTWEPLVQEPAESGESPAGGAIPLSTKPWFVVGTKADLDCTQETFASLQAYLTAVNAKSEPHPSGLPGLWCGNIAAIPVSGLRAEGMDRIAQWTVELLRSIP